MTMVRQFPSCDGSQRPQAPPRIALWGIFVVTLLATSASIAVAQKPAGAGLGTQSAAALAPSASKSAASDNPEPVKRFALSDLSWLAGRWQGQWGPRTAEQVWMPAKAGSMLGIFRTIADDKTLVVELLTLSEASDGIEYSLRHFTPALVPWEKSSPAVLRFASADSKKIVFENAVDGEPKHVIFEIVDANTYIARSEIIPEQGDPQIVEITYHRQKDPPEAH